MRQKRGNLRGSTIEISVRIATVKFDDASKVTYSALKLHPMFEKDNEGNWKYHLAQLVERNAPIVICM